MKQLVMLAFTIGLGVGCNNKPSLPQMAEADIQSAAQGDAAFAVDLHRKLAGDTNMVFSPASVSSALAMTYAGAAGSTAEEMKAVLHFNLDGEKLHNYNQRRLHTWNGEQGAGRPYELTVANALWGESAEPWNGEFLKLLETRYSAAFHPVDFMNERAAVREKVNEWVEKQTRGKIAEIVPQGSPSPDARLLLVNAISFKGKWAIRFDSSNTRPARFYRHDKSSVEVAMMHQKAEFRYGEVEKMKLVQLPFEGQAFSMVVLLPANIDGLAEMEATMTGERITGLVTSLRSMEVLIYLPAFKIESQFKLSDSLVALGMKSAFDPNFADFSGMNGKKDLFLSQVLHKAMIEVSEEGSKAGAATSVETKKSARGFDEPRVPEFRADHPFLFAIRDDRTGDLLFMGRMAGK